MKKWNEPKIYQLGVENTKTDICNHTAQTVFGNSGDTGLNKGHHCHKPIDPTCPGGNNDHSASGNKNHFFTGKICDEHNDANNGNEACCCFIS